MVQTQRNFGLDVIRALAILMVIVGHQVGKLYVLGHIAVEMFFVLSGFLIGGIFLRTIVLSPSTEWGHITEFWRRRWWRTLPSYFLFLAVFTLLTLARGSALPDHYERYFFFGQNLLWPMPVFYIVSWSLAIEEWFYFLMPLLFFFSQRALRSQWRAFLATVLVLFTVSYVLRFTLGNRQDYDAVRYTVLYRLDAMMVGVLAAAVADRRAVLWSKLKPFTALGALGLVVLGFLDYRSQRSSPSLSPMLMYSLFPWFAVLLLPGASSWAVGVPKLRKKVEFVALTSYSAYLCHLAIFFVSWWWIEPHFRGVAFYGVKLVTFLTIFLVSFLLFKYFETPMTARRSPPRTPNVGRVPHADIVASSAEIT